MRSRSTKLFSDAVSLRFSGARLMTSSDFRAWRRRMRFTQAAAADALGISAGSVELYERGRRRGADPRPVEIPRTVSLACAAIALGITEYPPSL